MPQTVRAFIALPIPQPVREALARLRAQLEPHIPGARWVATDNLHMTLAFLGDVNMADLAEIGAAVAQRAATLPELDLSLRGVGAFPRAERPRVVWAGFAGDNLHVLDELHRSMVEAARAAGYPSDERFSPHVTIARYQPGRRPSPNLAASLARFADWTGPDFNVNEVVVYQSLLSAGGPLYSPLSHAPLAPKSAS